MLSGTSHGGPQASPSVAAHGGNSFPTVVIPRRSSADQISGRRPEGGFVLNPVKSSAGLLANSHSQ